MLCTGVREEDKNEEGLWSTDHTGFLLWHWSGVIWAEISVGDDAEGGDPVLGRGTGSVRGGGGGRW